MTSLTGDESRAPALVAPFGDVVVFVPALVPPETSAGALVAVFPFNMSGGAGAAERNTSGTTTRAKAKKINLCSFIIHMNPPCYSFTWARLTRARLKGRG